MIAPNDSIQENELQTLLQQKATKANWRAIVAHLQAMAQPHQPHDAHDQLLNAAIAWVEEATRDWPAWVRYAEIPKRHTFPCPALVGEVYLTIRGWDDPTLAEELPHFSELETLSINLPLECCDTLAEQDLPDLPYIHKCILWAGHTHTFVEDPFVLRNAFWALRQHTPFLFQHYESLQVVEINANAEIDLIDDHLFIEAFASRERGEPWHSDERWEAIISEWRWLVGER